MPKIVNEFLTSCPKTVTHHLLVLSHQMTDTWKWFSLIEFKLMQTTHYDCQYWLLLVNCYLFIQCKATSTFTVFENVNWSKIWSATHTKTSRVLLIFFVWQYHDLFLANLKKLTIIFCSINFKITFHYQLILIIFLFLSCHLKFLFPL